MDRQLKDPGGAGAPEPNKRPLDLHDKLGIIGLIDQGMRSGFSQAPILADLFKDLWELVQATVSGSRIDHLRPEDSRDGFRVFEITGEAGETLARLNMIYLRKPIPCYYLVYVEVAGPFRRKGLGTRILTYFREFLSWKSALGILDNIIPKDDPTYDIYFKQAWEPIETMIGDSALGAEGNYMVYVPPAFQGRPLKEPMLRLLHHMKRRRAAIEMRDNEVMVQRTITEFRDIYGALFAYFQAEIEKREPSPLMRFMFTRFVTKLIAFRRRIGKLVGYTGGESLSQISLAPEILALKAKTYTPGELAGEASFVFGDKGLWKGLPELLKRCPARFIELLPNYQRPSLRSWLQEKGRSFNNTMTIGDFMDLGFDPTRLKEWSWQGRDHIFERIQARQLNDLRRKEEVLREAVFPLSGTRVGNTTLRVNPPLLVIQDKGNAYILRRKIDGIHWEEAVEQLQSSVLLKGLNAQTRLDRVVVRTVGETRDRLWAALGVTPEDQELLSFFVPWDLKRDRPRVVVDWASTYLDSIWVA